MVQLRFATERTVDLIVREYERRTREDPVGRQQLCSGTGSTANTGDGPAEGHCPAQVCRMISEPSVARMFRERCCRGEVSRFAGMKEEILIAPAMAIERGHNIVDEYGPLCPLRGVFHGAADGCS